VKILVLFYKLTKSQRKVRFLILNTRLTSTLAKKEIQMGSVEKSYMRKGFLIYEEMRKYLIISEEAVNHI
jgi:hypothetical protein